jgi:hypothetical protein
LAAQSKRKDGTQQWHMTDRILYKKDTEQGSNELHKPYGT